MSPALIFQLTSGLLAFLLVAGFVIYRSRYVIWRGYFRAIVTCEDKDVIIRTMKLKMSDTEFTIKVKGKLDTYHILDDRVYRIGRFRIPTAYYIAHRSEPINMLELKIKSEVSATRYREIAKNTVTSQLLTAFQENPLREAMAYMLAVVIILAGILMLGYFLNSKLETISQQLGAG